MIDTKGKTETQVVKEIFEALVKQGRRCISEHEGLDCVYGNEKDDHCGVGMLLPADCPELMSFMGDVDELVLFIEENQYLLDVVVNFEFIKKHKDLLDEVQTMHDFVFGYGSPKGRRRWDEELKSLRDYLGSVPDSVGEWASLRQLQEAKV